MNIKRWLIEPDSRWTTIFWTVLLGVIFTIAYMNFFVSRSYMEVEIQTFADEPTNLKIYWSDEQAIYTEDKARRSSLNERFIHHRFFLGDLANIDHFRIDPIEYTGNALIKRIRIQQPGFETIELNSRKDFERILALNDIDELYPQDDGLVVKTSGPDSQLILNIDPLRRSMITPGMLVTLLVLFGVAYGISRIPIKIFSSASFVPSCLLVAAVLAMTMASITAFNVHPDEKAHFRAMNYYSSNLLPPSLELPELNPTFSDFGRSRLGDFEIYYPLGGYLIKFMSAFDFSALFSARLFSVSMLFILALLAFRFDTYRYLTLPLLLTPQAWYLFSYANSDAFGLFMCFIFGFQAVNRQSMLNRFLFDDESTRFRRSAVILGLFCGSMLLLKETYYFYLLFLALYLFWRVFFSGLENQKMHWSRFGLLVVIGAALFAGRIGWDFVVNGPNPKTTRAELAEKHALYIYKPSTPLAEKHAYLYLKERGAPLSRLIHTDNWGTKTLGSSFGIYGYTQYLASPDYYNTMAILSVVLIAIILFSILINGPPSTHSLFIIVLFSAGFLLTMTLILSWIQMFQAQGRYLAPILPMLGILIYHVRSYLSQRAFYFTVLTMFGLSLYSFIFIGLGQIEKVSYLLG